MVQRAQTLLLVLAGLAGLVVVGAMLLWGRDIHQAAATGPRWRRKLLSAALLLLGAAGVASFKGGCILPMCYAPAPQNLTTQPTAAKLTDELDLIEKQIAAGQVSPEVIERRLDTIAEQARLQATPADRKSYVDPEVAAKADNPIVTAEARASRLWAAVHAGSQTPLDRSEDWRAVLAYWHYATPLIDVSTVKQRAVAAEMQQRAQVGLKALADSKLLDPPEAQLLVLESSRLMDRMLAHPPIDWMVTCYVAVAVIPARESLDRLSARADLLEAALKDGRIEPAVAERVLDTIKSDLAVLSDPKQLEGLPPAERAKAQAVSQRINAVLPKLEPPASQP